MVTSAQKLNNSQTSTNESVIVFALKLSLPIFFAFFPVGLAFGIIATGQGLSIFATFAMSFFVYAGSSEFLLVSMIASFESLFEIALTSFFVNFRHVFYGLAVHDKLPRSFLARNYVIATLSDEAFSLLTTLKSEHKQASFWICMFIHSYWFLSVLLGAVAGGLLEFQISGLDFCLPALFTCLCVGQYKEHKKRHPFVLTLPCMLLAGYFAPEQFLVVGILLSLAAILLGFYKGKLK